MQGRRADQVMAIPQQLGFLNPLQGFFPQLKAITVYVLEAKDLVAKDSHMFSKATSDPYYKLQFSNSGGKKHKVRTGVARSCPATERQRWCGLAGASLGAAGEPSRVVGDRFGF